MLGRSSDRIVYSVRIWSKDGVRCENKLVVGCYPVSFRVSAELSLAP